MPSTNDTRMPGWRESEPLQEASDDPSGEPGHPIRPEGRGPDDVDDGSAADDRSTGRRCGGHAGGDLRYRGGRRVAVDVWRFPRGRCYHTAPLVPFEVGRSCDSRFTHVPRTSMARSCAICGKVSMGGFNPQSSGMNRVRAHRRYAAQSPAVHHRPERHDDEGARLHALPPHDDEERQVARFVPRHDRPVADWRPVFVCPGMTCAPRVRVSATGQSCAPRTLAELPEASGAESGARSAELVRGDGQRSRAAPLSPGPPPTLRASGRIQGL